MQEAQEGALVRHAHADGAAGFTQVPPEVGASAQDEGESAGPEGTRTSAGGLGYIDAQRVDRVDGGDEHGWGHLSSAALGGQDRSDGLGVGSVRANAVDGVRGDDEKMAVAQLPLGAR